jgi:hypothetical protein
MISVAVFPNGSERDEFTYISIARLYLHNGIFFWNAKDYEINENGKDSSTWVAAKQVRWRVKDECLGAVNIYMKD